MFGNKNHVVLHIFPKNSYFEFGFRRVEESNFRAYVYNK